MLDDRTPVIVGVAHEVHRPGAPEDVVDAVTLMIAALRSAGADTGVPGVLAELDRVAVVQGLWRWPDPGRLLADAVGASSARTALASACGSTPQVLVADAAERIAGGRADIVAVCGGEWVSGRRQLKALGQRGAVTAQAGGQPDEVGEILPYETDLEVARGFEKPLFMYPLMESAIRYRRGESLEENRDRCATLVSRLSEVAATNPAAWLGEAWTPAEVSDVTPANRMVAFPYTKRMVSNERVDMASAIVLTSVGTARRLGISEDRWVFPHAAAQLVDPHFFSELDRYDESANMALACRSALELAGLAADDVAVLDLYSCFPSAVQIEADILGIGPDDPRPLTVSGGMATFGGPIANYVGHVIVDMVNTLRRRPGDRGLCVANGGYLNRPAAGVYGAEPPATPYQRRDLSAVAAALPHKRAVGRIEGTSTVESITALSVRGTPPRGLATGRAGDDRRLLAWTEDPELLDRITHEELVGRTMTTNDDGRIESIR